MSVTSVYAVFGSSEEAEHVGRIIIEERLGACVNILGPIRSIYRWKAGIESSDEVAAIFKTSTKKADALIARIAALHSYELPCITTWPIEKVLGPYADWIEESVD